MSFLVAMARAHYHDNAFDAFTASPGYSLENARAMMWMSQLAYDTLTARSMGLSLGLDSSAFALAIRCFPSGNACAVEIRAAESLTLSRIVAGNDPLMVATRPPATTTHALPSRADDRIAALTNARSPAQAPTLSTGPIAARPNTEQALFFTGHSLGGALALIAAERAARDPAVNARATGVYVFGCPRAGGDAFFNSYTPLFGDSTFRLVHGSDIVATVPPAGLFRHVGRLIQCDLGGCSHRKRRCRITTNDKPEMAELVEAALKADVRDIVETGAINPSIGTRPVAQTARGLLRIFRDHVPDNYFRALSVTIG